MEDRISEILNKYYEIKDNPILDPADPSSRYHSLISYSCITRYLVSTSFLTSSLCWEEHATA